MAACISDVILMPYGLSVIMMSISIMLVMAANVIVLMPLALSVVSNARGALILRSCLALQKLLAKLYGACARCRDDHSGLRRALYPGHRCWRHLRP